MRLIIRVPVSLSPRLTTWVLAVLLLWIYVVYNKNRWVLVLMSIFYLAEVAGVVTILTISFETFEGAKPTVNLPLTTSLTSRLNQRRRMGYLESNTAS